MADGQSPKPRPKRVKPDRPRPVTGSFRPTNPPARPGGEARPHGGPGGTRPSGPRPGGPRPGGSRPEGFGSGSSRSGGPRSDGGPPAGRFDPRIPRGPDDRPPGRPTGGDDRPNRSGFGFRAGADRPQRSGLDRPRPGGFNDRPRPAGDRRGPATGRPPGRPFVRPDSVRERIFERTEAASEREPERRFDRPGGPRPGYDRPPGPGRDRPAPPRPYGARPFGPRPGGGPGGPRPDRTWAERARPAEAGRIGLEPAEAGLVDSGDEIVAGRRPVEEAFVARREARRLLVVPQRRGALEKLVLHATSLRIPIVEVEGGSLTALTGFDGHQGIALVVAPRRYASVADILARAIDRGEAPFVLVLDSLEDPQNVGTLLRSAEAAGAHGVLFPTHRQAPLSPAAVKASAGAVEHLLLAPVDDLSAALADLHSAGLRVVGAEADAPLTVREADLRGPIALVVGSEGQGLGPAVRRRCDLMVRIPMRGAIGSLNASVAGSILLFEATTQRAAQETGGSEPAAEARVEGKVGAGPPVEATSEAPIEPEVAPTQPALSKSETRTANKAAARSAAGVAAEEARTGRAKAIKPAKAAKPAKEPKAIKPAKTAKQARTAKRALETADDTDNELLS
jgi:23S rRNA (guanosine2251-2'-O)-methyltransferase